MPFNTLTYLSRQDMEKLGLTSLDMVDAIQAMCEGREAGRVQAAPKSSIKPDDDRFYMSTLASADPPGYMAVKSLGLSENNSEHGLESIGSLITLFDAATGHPVAVMDGDWITGQRTAALSALAARFMANPQSEVIAFIGCGVQARSHLDIFADLYPLTEIRALGRGKKNRDTLLVRASTRGLSATPADDGRTVIADADVVITTVPAYPGMMPFMDARYLKPGAFVAMVDLARTWLPDSLDAIHRIIIDDRAQEATMSKPMIDPAMVTGDLQDLVSGRVTSPTLTKERAAFAFRGMAIGDLALASLAFDAASAKGLGCELPR